MMTGPRVLVLLTLLLAASALIVVWGATEEGEAATIKVPEDYTRLLDAVDDANPGDTIEIGAGTYNAAIQVKKPLTIVGAGEGQTVLWSQGWTYCLWVTSNNVRISNMTLRGGTSGALVLTKWSSSCVVRDVKCCDATGGLYIFGSGGHDIADVVCYNNSMAGVYLDDTSDNSFMDVTCEANLDGVLVSEGDNNTFRSCQLTNNLLLGMNVSRFSHKGPVTNLTVRDSVIARNGDDGRVDDGGGVRFFNARDLLIDNCTVLSNVGAGIYGKDPSTHVTISGCNVSLNEWRGMNLTGLGEGVVIEGCGVLRNEVDGIRLERSEERTLLANSSVESNVGTGVWIVDSSNVTLLNTTLRFNKGHQVHVETIYVGGYKARDIVITGCKLESVSGPSVGGVWVDSWSIGLELVDCEFVNTGYVGLHQSTNCNDTRVSNCTFKGSGRGMNILYAYNLTVAGCSFYGIDQVGLAATSSSIHIRDCDFMSCTHGIVLSHCVVEVTGCTISENKVFGIDFSYISNYYFESRIHNNTISKNGDTSDGQDGAGIRIRVNNTALVVENNTISENEIGLLLDGLGSYRWGDLDVVANVINDSAVSGVKYKSSYAGPNFYYLNSFIDNTAHVVDPIVDDRFDNGALGNFWGDYKTRYPSAKSLGLVWDTPYNLVSGLDDNYPLAYEYDVTPPVADAGTYGGVGLGERVDLDGSGSTDDQGIANYTWTFMDGSEKVMLYGRRAPYRFMNEGRYFIRLRVRDHWGNSDVDDTNIAVADDEPPVADAGKELTVGAGHEFQLNGSLSTDNLGIAAYVWTIDLGDDVIVLEGEVVTATIDVPGSYYALLNVTDFSGMSDGDRTRVTVVDMDPPRAVAGDSVEVDQGKRFVLDGSASTDNMGIVSYNWSYTMGEETVYLPELRRLRWAIDVPGRYYVFLNVSDAAGNWDIGRVRVTVRDTEPPVADAGENVTSEAGEEVTLDGSGSSDNVGIHLYNWSYEHDNATHTEWGMEVGFVFEAPGTYDVTLSVRDEAGNWDWDTVTITVFYVDVTPPNAWAGEDLTVDQGETVTLDGSNSTDDVAVVSWAWSFVEGGETVSLDGAVAEHTFDVVGVFTVTLSVKDEAGNEATDAVTVTVVDRTPPEVPPKEDETVVRTGRVTLDASDVEDDSNITSYEWTIEHDGEVTTLEGEQVDYTFLEDGDYVITLNVTDEEGNSATSSHTVTVTGGKRPWELGPFTDEEGEPVKDLVVEVELNGTTYSGTTDEEGMVELEVQVDDLGESANVTASGEEWEPVEFEMPLDEAGNPSTSLPEELRPAQGGGGGGDSEPEDEVPYVSLLLLLIVIIVVVAIIAYYSTRSNE